MEYSLDLLVPMILNEVCTTSSIEKLRSTIFLHSPRRGIHLNSCTGMVKMQWNIPIVRSLFMKDWHWIWIVWWDPFEINWLWTYWEDVASIQHKNFFLYRFVISSSQMTWTRLIQGLLKWEILSNQLLTKKNNCLVIYYLQSLTKLCWMNERYARNP